MEAAYPYRLSYFKDLNLQRSCSASLMFVTSKVDGFDVLRRKALFGFREKIGSSENSLVKTIVLSDFWKTSSLYSEMSDMLYM